MPTIAANTTTSVTLAAGQAINTVGIGAAVLGPGPWLGQQIPLQGLSKVGPFAFGVDVGITAGLAGAVAYEIDLDPNDGGVLRARTSPSTAKPAVNVDAIQALASSGIADLTCVTNLHAGNMTRTRAAKFGDMVLSIFGNSQVMGAGAGLSGTENCAGAKARNMPTMLARELTRRGMYATAGNFCGDQNAGGVGGGLLYADYDTAFVLGAVGAWLQTTLGRLMLRSTGAGVMAVITPPQSFDTMTFTYVSNNVSAAVSLDGGATIATLLTNSDSRIVSQTVTGITEGTHALTITANASNFFLRSVRFTSSARPGISIQQCGWYGAIAANFNSNSNNWDTFNTIRNNPDKATAVILRCIVNDANGATDPDAWKTTMRTICQGIIAGGSDLILSTDEPYSGISAVNGRAQLFIDRQKALALEFDCPHIDLFQRYGPAYEALPGDYYSALHCAQPRQLTTAQVYAAFLAAV